MIEEQIRFCLKDHEGAVILFLLLRDILHFWDDLVDGDRHLTPADINAAMFKTVVALPANALYREHQAQLQPILVNAIANWQAANEFENSGDEKKLELAFVIRSDYANLLIQMAYLVGGYDWMTQVTPSIRALWTEENFQDYLVNLKREQSTRKDNTHVL